MAAKKVDLNRLAAALGDYGFAYLITVDDGYRAHAVAVEPVLNDGGVIDVGPVVGHSRKNLAQRNDVTVLWPPRERGGYSLIVDGRAEVADSDDLDASVGVIPTRAVLHRSAIPGSVPSAAGCRHDCIVLA